MNDCRYLTYLRGRYRFLSGHLGYLVALVGLLFLVPLPLLFVFPEETPLLGGFLFPGLGLLLLGGLLRACAKVPEDSLLSLAEGSLLVVLAWFAAIFAGAVPFVWAGLDWTGAVFESTSGWTTTGLSVLDVAQTSPLLLFWRSFMQYAGGAGLAILMLSAMTGPTGIGLSAAEGRGEQLVPQVRQSARLVLRLYFGYLLFGVPALYLAGMSWFDAVNHAFCALSTGGFSTRVDSIAYWNSPAVEAVLMLLMGLGTLNFLTAYTLLKGHWRAVLGNGEVRVAALLLPLATAVLFFGGAFRIYPSLPEHLRILLFQVVSALSTTGFQTIVFSGGEDLGYLVLILLMLIGGGANSTAGGIKLHRIYLLLKGLRREALEASCSPREQCEEGIWIGGRRRFLGENEIRKAAEYVGLFLFVWLLGSCALTAFGHSLRDSLFEFASALGTVGLTAGITGPATPAGQLWVQIFGMLFGRLEFFVIFWGLAKLVRDMGAFGPRPVSRKDS
ncbi:TrkH family potassium uptake protein [Trichloromonas sp.]|uniref:TrkH family potassium uptake protein n=1 Tax=Trichloromonas sp. TaxID=3069249 RepID=UPI002A4601BB|nr:TrkH family potassium uptake protein [Trichloromonas sp.]